MSILKFSLTRYISVSFQFAAIHNYPAAEGKHGYLKYPHRHLFKGSLKIEVYHNDREVEFLALQDEVNSFCKSNYSDKDVGKVSCEMMAEAIGMHIINKYAGRNLEVKVFEDGENGAILKFKHE